MESGYTLITVIVNSGYAEAVMAAARSGGASGGSILNARGTGTEEDVKFFGITLVPEKEMLLICDAEKPVPADEMLLPHIRIPEGTALYPPNVQMMAGVQEGEGGAQVDVEPTA